ncbi:DNA polymerase subunit III [Candidatus Symbiobacter mobilis CR]|uniref:DNA polymerase subunit III n=1 Tax=Candidatus Symbiobacter mobilis CR TaxID=946483 RepID=U5N648_9BURK|nr:DNA polymerase subunit III [Candidatus Symbiobacter mobilis CR]
MAQPPVAPRADHGDFWCPLAEQLLQDPAVTAMVRELALRSQLQDRQGDVWTLLVESTSLVRDANRDRLAAALERAGWKVRLTLEVGAVTDTLALRRAVEQGRQQERAAQIVAADPFVQALVREFGARIVPESIRMM